jgi:hypothetical protein
VRRSRIELAVGENRFRLLSGITLDVDDDLKTMSSAENWRVSHDAMYRQHSSEFRRAAERPAKRGTAKRLDTAALAYMHVTLTCINCHKYVKVARGEPPSPGLQFALKRDRSRSAALGRLRKRN